MQACPAGLLPQLEQGGLVERLAVLGRGAGPPRQNTNSSCEKSWHAQNYALRLLHHQSEPTASNQPSQRQPLISRYVLRLRPLHAPLRLLSLPSLRCLPDPRTLANATGRRSSLRHLPLVCPSCPTLSRSASRSSAREPALVSRRCHRRTHGVHCEANVVNQGTMRTPRIQQPRTDPHRASDC